VIQTYGPLGSFFCFQRINDSAVGRILVIAFRHRHQHAFRRSPAMLDSDALPTPSGPINGFQPYGARLTQHLPHFRVVAAVVNEVDIFFFRRASSAEKSFSPAVMPSKKTIFALPSFRLLDGARQTFAVLLFVMNDGDTLRLHFFEDVFGGGRPL
jgi:hypothetical protein